MFWLFDSAQMTYVRLYVNIFILCKINQLRRKIIVEVLSVTTGRYDE